VLVDAIAEGIMMLDVSVARWRPTSPK